MFFIKQNIKLDVNNIYLLKFNFSEQVLDKVQSYSLPDFYPIINATVIVNCKW